MSDEELEAAIERAKKEVELVRLQKETKSKGEKFIEDVLYDVGKNALTTTATGALIYMGGSWVSGQFDAAELGNAMLRGNGSASSFTTKRERKKAKQAKEKYYNERLDKEREWAQKEAEWKQKEEKWKVDKQERELGIKDAKDERKRKKKERKQQKKQQLSNKS